MRAGAAGGGVDLGARLRRAVAHGPEADAAASSDAGVCRSLEQRLYTHTLSSPANHLRFPVTFLETPDIHFAMGGRENSWFRVDSTTCRWPEASKVLQLERQCSHLLAARTTARETAHVAGKVVRSTRSALVTILLVRTIVAGSEKPVGVADAGFVAGSRGKGRRGHGEDDGELQDLHDVLLVVDRVIVCL